MTNINIETIYGDGVIDMIKYLLSRHMLCIDHFKTDDENKKVCLWESIADRFVNDGFLSVTYFPNKVYLIKDIEKVKKMLK